MILSVDALNGGGRSPIARVCLCYRLCALADRRKIRLFPSIFTRYRDMFQVVKNSFRTALRVPTTRSEVALLFLSKTHSAFSARSRVVCISYTFNGVYKDAIALAGKDRPLHAPAHSTTRKGI